MSVPAFLNACAISGFSAKLSTACSDRKYLKNINPYHCLTCTPCCNNSFGRLAGAGLGHSLSMRCFSFNAFRTIKSPLQDSYNFFSKRSCTLYFEYRMTMPRTNAGSSFHFRMQKSRASRSACARGSAGRKDVGESSSPIASQRLGCLGTASAVDAKIQRMGAYSALK